MAKITSLDVALYSTDSIQVHTRTPRTPKRPDDEDTWIEFGNMLTVWLSDAQVRELIKLLQGVAE